jgi:hypothetical protein
LANRFHPKGHKTLDQIKAIKAKEAEKNRPKVSFVSDVEEKKLLLGLNKKSNRELNDILNKPHLPPKFRSEIDKIFDLRMEKDPEFQEHRAESFWNGLTVDQRRLLLKNANVGFFVEANVQSDFKNLSSDLVQTRVINAVNKQHSPETMKNVQKQQEELIRKRIAGKGFDTSRINISVVK